MWVGWEDGRSGKEAGSGPGGAAMAVWLVAGFAGAASAQTAVEEQYADQDGEIPALRARVEEQDASLEARIDEITAVGADLEEAQSRVDNARARAGELGEQTRSLERDLATQRKSLRDREGRL